MEKQGKLFTTFGIFGVLPVSLMRDPRAGANELRAYAAIQSYQGVKAAAYPDQVELAERAGLTKRVLQRAIKNLKGWGWLHTERKGFGKSNIYRCLIPVEIPTREEKPKRAPRKKAENASSLPPTGGANEELPLAPTTGASLPPTGGGSLAPTTGGYMIKKTSNKTMIKDQVTADAVAQAKTEMHTDLRYAFDVLHAKIHGGAKYAHDGKEAKNIDRVITKALGLVDHDPVKARELIREKLALFCRNLAKPPTDFWADKPCTPSMLYSLWSHLVEEREVKRKHKLFRGRDPFLESIPEGVSLDAILGGNYQEVAHES